MKRTIRNLVGVLLLSLALAATQIPVETSEAANAASEFQMDKDTLVKYTGTASTVSIPSTVKTIGEEAFSGNETVVSIEIPKSVEKVSSGAFSGCSALKRVVVSSSVTSIGNGAFAGCTDLTSINIGAAVKEIGNGVFAGCTKLTTVAISKDNTHFVCEKSVLYNKDKTELIQMLPGRSDTVFSMPSTVEKLDEYAFWGCENLESVTLSHYLEEVPAYSFSNCKSLKEANLPYSIKSIGIRAFEDCVNLEILAIPESVGTIHETAFDGCTKLVLSGVENTVGGDFAERFNNAPKDNAEYEDISESVTVSENTQSEGIQSESTNEEVINDTYSQTASILGTSIIVGNRAVVFIDNTRQTVKSGNPIVKNENITMNEQEKTVSDADSVSGMLDNAQNNEKGTRIPKYTVVDDKIIANQAFYKDSGMTTYSFPEGIQEIGEFSFARSSLTSISIPNGVTEIGYGAFYHCDSLEDVSIPSSVTYVEPMAFEETGWLRQWKTASSGVFLTVGDGLLIAYNGNESIVTIPEGVKAIGPQVFKEHKGITKVYLPDSLQLIGEEAFAGCVNLSSVSGGTYVEIIKDRAFAGCPIDTIRIPDTVTSLGLKAYDFSETTKNDDEKVVVFHGSQIPVITNEKTAERLSNASYRDLALKGVNYAVIDANVSMEELKNTVLDSAAYGFKGMIVSSDETTQSAVLRGTTLTAEELAEWTLPQSIQIYGRQYTLTGTGNLSQMAGANENSYYNSTGSILIQNTISDLETKKISASLQGNTGAYYLALSEDEDAKNKLNQAYVEIYQKDFPANVRAWELSLYDEKTKVAIRKLGKQNMTISMPLPSALRGGTLHIICTDANGQLEDILYEKESVDGEEMVTFTVNHFSDFGFYTIGNQSINAQGQVKDGKVIINSYSQKDDSPNTGDLIHPKWFLAVGLLFGALAFFFYKGKRNIKA